MKILITEINNTQVNDAQYIDVAMPMCNSIEYSKIIRKHLEFYVNIVEMYRL